MFRAVLPAVAAFYIILLVGGCGSDDERLPASVAAETLDRAWANYAQKRFSDALIEFERAAKLDPNNADAVNGIGWTQLSLVEGIPSGPTLDLAIGSFRAALERDREFADAWVGLGNALFLRRAASADYDDAAASFDAAFRADSISLFRHDYARAADVYAIAAWCYYLADEPESAGIRARQALADDPTEASATLLLDLIP